MTALRADMSVRHLPLKRPVAGGERKGPRNATKMFLPKKKPVTGPKSPAKWTRAQPSYNGSMVSDRKMLGGDHHVFDQKNMEELSLVRTRNLSPSARRHAARVRVKGACENCKTAKRKVTLHLCTCYRFL